MQILNSALPRLVLVSAVGLLAACGRGGPGLPSSQLPSAARAAAGHHGSWMADDAKSQDLVYVADLGTDDVNVYSYPGGSLKGVLEGFSAVHYECVDAAGNVFIANGGANELLEYAHGGTAPIRIYHEPGFTHGCSIDPTTGNLAVLHDPASSAPGGISIYRHARGKPHEYTTPNVFRVYFIGYDGQGDLFVDGTDMHVAFEISELPSGGTAFEAVTLNQSIVLPGAIQWDGQHLAVGDQVSIYGPSKIYEFSMSGTTGTLVGSTPLSNSCDVLQFWIQSHRVIAGNDCAPHVLYFSYPSGGSSTKTISRKLKEPVGVTVSLK
ncbi:MAG: hypothetical protein WA814_11370 [Candidatus Baltobacteraceae bacterium]